MNAKKHGAYGKKFLTPDEDDAELAALERKYVAHYRPPSPLELHDVRQLALMDWRLQRYARLEAESLTLHGYEREHDNAVESLEFASAGWGMIHDCSKSRVVQAISQVENRLRKHFACMKSKLDGELEKRITEGELLVSNSIAKMAAASN